MTVCSASYCLFLDAGAFLKNDLMGGEIREDQRGKEDVVRMEEDIVKS
jgi:hypothetical protein